jgi:hypothetical protein
MLGITARCQTVSWYVDIACLSHILPSLTFVIPRLASETVIPILCSTWKTHFPPKWPEAG